MGTKYYGFKKRLHDLISGTTKLWRKRKFFRKGVNAKLTLKFKRVILIPKQSDTILRLTTKLRIWNDFKRGLPAGKDRPARYRRLRFYKVNKNMLTEKFGNFMDTRTFGGYRAQKDKQKIAKFTKDMEKEARKRIHQIKEKARLMAKALKEEKAAKKAKRTGRSVKGKK